MFGAKPRASNFSWWAAAVAMSTLTLATISGNAGVVTSLWRARRSATHYPLASLAAADLLVGTCVLPIAAARELFTFKLNSWICAFWSTLDVLCCTASILSLCALGWERWSGITDPFSRERRHKVSKILAVLVWPVATAVALPTILVESHELGVEKACTVNTNTGYVFFSIAFSFYIPTVVMIVLYGQILQALATAPPVRAHRGQATATVGVPIPEDQEQNPAPDPSAPQEQNADATSRQRRATVTITRLMTLFLICWCPFFIMLPIDSLCACVKDAIWQWCTWLGYANSALNPLVYAAAAPCVGDVLNAILRRARLS